MVKISGGDKLASALTEIARNASKASEVDVGFLEGATYPDGTSVPLVAAIQEYGSLDYRLHSAVAEKLGVDAESPGIPPRPYFRSMIEAKSPEWPAAVAGLLKDNDYDATKTLSQTGAAIKGQLQQSIVDLVSPPLKPATIARKGFDKPLVDTGHMLQSVDYAVK